MVVDCSLDSLKGKLPSKIRIASCWNRINHLLKNKIKGIVMNVINLIKATRNIISGRSMTSFLHSFNIGYPISSQFILKARKIDILCIMCGYPRTGTHWIRNVVEKSTGQPTFDLIRKPPLIRKKSIY